MPSTLGNAIAHGLDLRIPTANPETSPAHRDKIRAKLKPGDIVLTSDTSYLLWETVEYCVARSHYTHAFLYEGGGKILEATIDSGVHGVMRSSLDVALQGPLKIAVIRPPYDCPEDVEVALDFCRGNLGKGYDGLFDLDKTDGQRFYCSSLIYEAFQLLSKPIKLERKKVLGRWLVAPDAFLDMEGETIVYRDRFSLWESFKGASPTGIGAAAATIGFHCMLPHLAPLAGFYLAVSAGNKLQTGNFGLTSGPAKVCRMDQGAE